MLRCSRGIGRGRRDFGLGVCRDAGIEAVHLEANLLNVRGDEFYKRLGFRNQERHLMPVRAVASRTSALASGAAS